MHLTLVINRVDRWADGRASQWLLILNSHAAGSATLGRVFQPEELECIVWSFRSLFLTIYAMGYAACSPYISGRAGREEEGLS